MKVAIVGAGVAGLTAAKVLRQAGVEPVVFDRTPDVGGVWSCTRRYPGLQLQNDKGTYALSDRPMPAHYPQWPSGQQVQQYLESYASAAGLEPHLRLSTEVECAEFTADQQGWLLTTRAAGAAETTTEAFDQLIVANGIFCEPDVPDFDGLAEFQAVGGQVLAANELHDAEDAHGRHVIVVGHGKSACDIAAAVSGTAASTALVARELLWKMPRRLGGVLNYKVLLLTRLGEGLFRYLHPRGIERFLHGPGDRVRRMMLAAVQELTTIQLRLRPLGLVPDGDLQDIARSTVSLATDGFSRRVAAGRIRVHRDNQIVRLLQQDGQPAALLSDGRTLPADLVVCGTGFRQAVPFLPTALQDRLTDDRGNFVLYRHIQPLDVPRLFFNGYNSSLFSPLSAEMAAIWIASRLLEDRPLPPFEQRRDEVQTRLRWMEERTHGHHARGTNVIPFSMHSIDETLDELGLNVGPFSRAAQWLIPVRPQAYRQVTSSLLRRAATTRGAQPPVSSS